MAVTPKGDKPLQNNQIRIQVPVPRGTDVVLQLLCTVQLVGTTCRVEKGWNVVPVCTEDCAGAGAGVAAAAAAAVAAAAARVFVFAECGTLRVRMVDLNMQTSSPRGRHVGLFATHVVAYVTHSVQEREGRTVLSSERRCFLLLGVLWNCLVATPQCLTLVHLSQQFGWPARLASESIRINSRSFRNRSIRFFVRSKWGHARRQSPRHEWLAVSEDGRALLSVCGSSKNKVMSVKNVGSQTRSILIMSQRNGNYTVTPTVDDHHEHNKFKTATMHFTNQDPPPSR